MYTMEPELSADAPVKKRRGRPRLQPEPGVAAQLSVRVRSGTKLWLCREADRTDRTIAQVVDEVLAEAIVAREREAETFKLAQRLERLTEEERGEFVMILNVRGAK